MSKKIALFALALLLPCIVLAETLESYKVDFQIMGDYLLSTIEYDFASSSDKDLNVVLPSDAWNVSLSIDGRESAAIIANNNIRIPLKESTKKAKLAFYTKELLNYNSPTGVFFTEIIAPFDSESVKSTLTLPAGSALIKPAEDTNVKPTRVETDGQNIKLVWEGSNVSKNSKISALAVFNREAKAVKIFTDLRTNIIVLSLALIVIAQVGYLVIYRKNKVKQIEDNLSKKFSIDEYLKEEESQIINVLRMKEGQTSQGTLRVVTGMPKATLSKLLSELEARNVIHKEKSGKKNIISLREHFRNNNSEGEVI